MPDLIVDFMSTLNTFQLALEKKNDLEEMIILAVMLVLDSKIQAFLSAKLAQRNKMVDRVNWEKLRSQKLFLCFVFIHTTIPIHPLRQIPSALHAQSQHDERKRSLRKCAQRWLASEQPA